MKKILLVVVFFVYAFTFLGATDFTKINKEDAVGCDWIEFDDTSALYQEEKDILKFVLENPEDILIFSYSAVGHERLNFFFHQELKEYTKLIKFSKGKYYIANHVGQIMEEKKFSWHILFLIISIIGMINLNRIVKNKVEKIANGDDMMFAALALVFGGFFMMNSSLVGTMRFISMLIPTIVFGAYFSLRISIRSCEFYEELEDKSDDPNLESCRMFYKVYKIFSILYYPLAVFFLFYKL
jgi:hypothetical protein